MSNEYDRAVAKKRCTEDHVAFIRYFFKHRQGQKFIVNWHHIYMADELNKVLTGETQNLVITVPPGSSKTEEAVINFIARGLAKNPRARFLHLSYSAQLALLNSETAREIVRSEEYQDLWNIEIAKDSKARARWNVMQNGKKAGGVYATSLGGQITGFRAGHMAPGFQGAILIDDPLKPEDAYSKVKVKKANRQLLSTVKSRKAAPHTPIIVIMQRLSQTDPVGFIKQGGLPGKWRYVVIPAIIDDDYVKKLPKQYRELIDDDVRDKQGRFSYWETKEPISELNEMESGGGADKDGNQISKQVFNSQYQQDPVQLGGNIIKGEFFPRYKVLPRLKARYIFGDTAQKTKEHNDYSVLQCWGEDYNGGIYMLDQVRGKWEAPELGRRTIAFWAKHAKEDVDKMGHLREIRIEDKSSGTGLIQTIKKQGKIPIKGIERTADRFTRVSDALPYIEAGMAHLPEDAPWLSDYLDELEAYTPDDTHEHDDQVDPTVDAVTDLLSTKNKTKTWEDLADD